MMWDTTMNPETRVLRKVTMIDCAYAEQMFEILLGEEVPPRAKYITEHFEEWIGDVE